jgi:hypothetical protein
MTMTRHDYIMLAAVLRDRITADPSALGVVTVIAHDLCALLHEDNPNFDKPRFLRGVGILH